jgi:hypothetical protein
MKSLVIATCLAAASALAVSAQAQTSSNMAAPSLRCADFQRSADGSWTAQRPTLVPYPGGLVPMATSTRIPGNNETYMGLRLGMMLDEQCGAAGRR